MVCQRIVEWALRVSDLARNDQIPRFAGFFPGWVARMVAWLSGQARRLLSGAGRSSWYLTAFCAT
jgi:hypothetical protein